MNKSIEFMERVCNRGGDAIPKSGWDKAKVISTPEFIEQMLGYKPFDTLIEIKCNLGELKHSIHYDPEAEFEYFTSSVSKHDGTLCFFHENAYKPFYNVVTRATYNQQTAPKDYQDNPEHYSIKYTVGDIVVHTTFGMQDINGQQIHGEKDVAVLPIKCEWELVA